MIYETVYALGTFTVVAVVCIMLGYEIRRVQEYRAKERREQRKEARKCQEKDSDKYGR